jgi:two-component system sensor histidine kinase PhoQ
MASRPLSLNVRLLIGASAVLIAFLGATAFALDVAFRESAASAARDRLQGHVFTLLAAANVDINGALFVPDSVPEPRFSRPGSGLYAQIHGKDFQWQSESLLGVRTEIPGNDMGPGELRFSGPDQAGDEELFVFQQGVAWELDDGSERGFTFAAAESSQAYHEQIRGFRQALWGWLGAATIVLLAVQGSILRWGLGPLREIAGELRLVEQGEKERITGRYPRELAGLSENLNAFIGSERRRKPARASASRSTAWTILLPISSSAAVHRAT